MKKSIFTFLFLALGLSLSAQIKPIKGKSKIKKGSIISDQFGSDKGLKKCDIHIKYQKIMWKHLLNNQNASGVPLDLSSKIPKLRITNGSVGIAKLIFRGGVKSIKMPPLTNIKPVTGYNPFPVPVTGTGILETFGPYTLTISFHWETGSYGIIKDVEEIYKVGSLHYIDVKNTNNVSHTIRIFPNYRMDGCPLPQK